jgi:hypothetical protein
MAQCSSTGIYVRNPGPPMVHASFLPVIKQLHALSVSPSPLLTSPFSGIMEVQGRFSAGGRRVDDAEEVAETRYRTGKVPLSFRSPVIR